MSPLARWAVVSAVSFVAIETALYTRGTLYTHTYRDARAARHGWVPLAVAAVVFAHLEGWIPPQMDPFCYAAKPLELWHR